MDIKQDFLKIRPKITVSNWWKFVGSFNRNPEYSKNISYITDIDIFNFTKVRLWSDAKKIINNTNPMFIYLTCGMNKDFIVDFIDYENPDYNKIQKKINLLYENSCIGEDNFKTFINYADMKNKEGLVRLDFALTELSFLRWSQDDIKKGYIMCGNTKYEIETVYEKITSIYDRATFHLMWLYPEYDYLSDIQNFIPIDCTIIEVQDKQGAHDYFKKEREKETTFNTTYFYKRMYYYYVNKDWYKLFRELRIPCIDFKLFDILSGIVGVTEGEFKLHKAILSKLQKMSTILTDPKYNNYDQDSLQGIKKRVLYDAQKIDFKTKETEIPNIYKEFKYWFNNKMPEFYNKWRSEIIKANPSIEKLLTPSI